MTNTPKTPPFFQLSADVTKPYALMDLDDTLFQTQRKIDAWQLPTSEKSKLVCASVNKQGEPLSFMTARQAAFFNWLLVSTELIVVTARNRKEVKRVKLPFNSWQVLTHGAVILKPDGNLLPAWQALMFAALTPLQERLHALVDIVESYNIEHNIKDNTEHKEQPALKLTTHSDTFKTDPLQSAATAKIATEKTVTLTIYLAIKHKKKDPQALQDFAAWLMSTHPTLADDFYIHQNANNLAILPHVVHKRHAVAFLLDNALDSNRPSFGFGDSLADLPYLQQLDWYGMPNHGQLHDWVADK